jgi:Lamin Tail Domain
MVETNVSGRGGRKISHLSDLCGDAWLNEYVEIVNRGTAPADISGWVLGADDAGQDFRFPPGTILQPGQRIRVYTDEFHPESGGFNYGIRRPIWNDRGDTAQLRDTAGTVVSDYAYGDRVPAP